METKQDLINLGYTFTTVESIGLTTVEAKSSTGQIAVKRGKKSNSLEAKQMAEDEAVQSCIELQKRVDEVTKT